MQMVPWLVPHSQAMEKVYHPSVFPPFHSHFTLWSLLQQRRIELPERVRLFEKVNKRGINRYSKQEKKIT